LRGLALAGSKTDSLGITVRAVPADLMDEPGFKTYMSAKSGSLDLSDPQTILVGEEAARTLRLTVGDRLRLVTARAGEGGGMLPRQSSFTVGGIVSCGYQDLDKLWVFVNIDRGRRVLPAESAYEFLAVKVADPFGIPNPLFAGETRGDDIAGRLQAALGPRWQAYTWFELQRTQYLSFLTTRNLLLVIMALIVLVASVNISSAMIMLVMEKQQEIAILKSLGARPAGIACTFIMAGGITGAIGGLLGLSLGALAALRVNEIIAGLEGLTNLLSRFWWQLSGQSALRPFESVTLLNPAFYLERIPIDIRPADLLFMGGLTVFLSMAASWFPARRAARLRPLAVFRKV
jgi:lipoprotein-releasing system permease protein